MNACIDLDPARVWDTGRAVEHLQLQGVANSQRTGERRLLSLGVVPPELTEGALHDELGRPPNTVVLTWAIEAARRRRHLPVFAQLHPHDGATWLHVNDARGGRTWVAVAGEVTPASVRAALRQIQSLLARELVVFPHGALVGLLRAVASWEGVALALAAYAPVLDLPPVGPMPEAATPHLRRLEAESIHIIREAVAEAENPVMLYSVGKDSGVMLHLAQKAFAPARPPFPLLHVDTRWKFQEMYLFREHVARTSGLELRVHINPDAVARDINPFDHGSALHTDITKTEGLKQALNAGRFDVVFGGARRDEEKSRAKERVFSFRTASHHWDPKNQRPELWNLYNARRGPGESIRVFPLSNWTELDVWQYILLEGIPVVPLYFSKERPVVERGGSLLMVDDSRFRLLPDEQIQMREVRFRTLGCYPLTGAVTSSAHSVADIVLELVASTSSERQGRVIDADSAGSMEKKKQEGYF